MKVLQLIDSLHAGGAERVAVNYANSLATRIEASFLCATREEGLLKESLYKDVQYLFLNKKSTLDFKAITRLNRFVKSHKISIVHAHASSFFIATIIKILNPDLSIIWHDHYGKSEFLNERPKFVLKWCSKLFSQIIAVNAKLENWSKDVLDTKSVCCLPNFAIIDCTESITRLKGEDDKRIVCLANLRPQKDHITLLEAFKSINKEHFGWTLHLVGQNFNDYYSEGLKTFIIKNDLEKHVYIYGSCADISNILGQSTIGVLSSKSEGLPISLLEYGLAKLPVIATNVGDCNKVISNKAEGILIEPQKSNDLHEALLTYINDLDLRHKVANNLHEKIMVYFSESNVVESLINIYNTYKK